MITDEDVTIEGKRQYLLDCGYPAMEIAHLSDAEVEQWALDEIEEKRQYLLDCGYPAIAITHLSDAEVEQWVRDEIEEQERLDENERCVYEEHSLNSSYYEDARFL